MKTVEKELGVIDLLKRTFGVWKADWAKWLLPPLETYILSMIVGMAMGIVVTVVYLILFALFFALAIFAGFLPAIIIVVALGLVLYIGLIIVMLVFGGVVAGGLHTVVCRNLLGEKYEFFDVIKSGWKRKGTFFGITLINGLVQFAIMFVLGLPIVAVCIGVVVLAGIADSPEAMLASTFLLYIFVLVAASIIGFFMAILAPAFQTPYIASVFEELPATASFGRGMRFAMSHKGTYLKLGVLYTLVMMLSRYIPMVNILVQLFVPTYLYTTIQMYCMEHGLSPTMAVRRSACGKANAPPGHKEPKIGAPKEPMARAHKKPKPDAPKKPKANAAKGTGA